MFRKIDQLEKVFYDLGLTRYEAKVYLALLANGPSNAYDISKASGVPQPKIYETVDRLIHKGLVNPVDSNPKKYHPLPIEDFIKMRENEFLERKNILLSYKDRLSEGKSDSMVWLVRTYSSCMARARDILESAEKEILISFWPEQGKDLEKALRSAKKRGVSIISMQFSDPVLKIGKIYKHVQVPALFTRHGSELTIACDDRVSFFMRQIPGKDWEAYWTENKGVTRMVVSYIRHDIYINRALKDFNQAMIARYGENLEGLVEI